MLGTVFLHCSVDGEALTQLALWLKIACGFVSLAVLSHIAGPCGAQPLPMEQRARAGPCPVPSFNLPVALR